ncbi:MAG TPA: hypothetical protein ENJ09_05380 [Planctomycetes bacterium]|nr:hypothetical protein [Planctomycetota bacterium]
MRAPGIAAASLAAGLALACGEPKELEPVAPPPPSYPEGTALAVNATPVPRAEIEEVAAAIAERYPANVELQNLRLAVTNDTLELYAVRTRDAAAREEALGACEQERERIAAGEEPKDTVRMEGDFGEFRHDLRLWVRARRLPPGTWSDPIELTGRFVLARLDALEEHGPGLTSARTETVLHLTLVIFPYLNTSYRPGLDAATSIQEAVDAARLEIVDPAFEDVVPTEWKFRMGAY